jgi:hypothetical protein
MIYCLLLLFLKEKQEEEDRSHVALWRVTSHLQAQNLATSEKLSLWVFFKKNLIFNYFLSKNTLQILLKYQQTNILTQRT